MVDPQPAAVLQRGPTTCRNGAYAGLGQPAGPPRRKPPVLPALVERVRRGADGRTGGEHLLQQPGVRRRPGSTPTARSCTIPTGIPPVGASSCAASSCSTRAAGSSGAAGILCGSAAAAAAGPGRCSGSGQVRQSAPYCSARAQNTANPSGPVQPRPSRSGGASGTSSANAARLAAQTASRSIRAPDSGRSASTCARSSGGATAYSGSASRATATWQANRRDDGKYGEFWIGGTGATACTGLTSSTPAPWAAVSRASVRGRRSPRCPRTGPSAPGRAAPASPRRGRPRPGPAARPAPPPAAGRRTGARRPAAGRPRRP